MLFMAGGQTLLWAGRIGLQTQRELLAAYPGLRADILVMGAEPPPMRPGFDRCGCGIGCRFRLSTRNSMPRMPWARLISVRPGT